MLICSHTVWPYMENDCAVLFAKPETEFNTTWLSFLCIEASRVKWHFMKLLCHERLLDTRVVRDNWAFCNLSVIGSIRRRHKQRHQVKCDLEWLVFFSSFILVIWVYIGEIIAEFCSLTWINDCTTLFCPVFCSQLQRMMFRLNIWTRQQFIRLWSMLCMTTWAVTPKSWSSLCFISQ